MIKSFNKKTWGEKLFVAGMLLIPLAHLAVFWFYVNIDSLLLAFKMPQEGGEEIWSFENFRILFTEFSLGDSDISTALVNTLIFFAVSLFFSFPVSILIAYFIYKKIAWYRFFRVVLYLPCIISASVTAVLFRYIIAGNGPIAEILSLFGQEMPTLLGNSDYALKTIIFYTVFFGLGGNLVLFGGALNQVDMSVLESARIDGVNRLQELLYMIIPLIWPTLSTVLTLMFVGLFNSSGPILLFTQGGYNTNTLSYWIYHKVYYNQELNYPAAVGMFFTLIGAPIAIIMRWLLSKGVDDVTA